MNIYCGGIVGYANCINSTSIFGGCYSKGSIYISLNNANKAGVGGLAGQVYSASASISECSSDMNIEVANGKQTNVGGITGFFDGIGFENVCFNGNILLSYPSYGLAGGICGMTFGSTNFEYCLVTGSISKNYGTCWLSAISGTSGEGISVSNCYYLSGLPNSTSYGISMSESELKSGNAIVGFDNDIWVFPIGAYPYLGFTKPTYILNLALEGGYVGIRLNEGGSQKFLLSQDSDAELYQVLWNGEDITDLVNTNGDLTTPEIHENSVINVIYRTSDVIENKLAEKVTTFNVQGSSLIINNSDGIQDLQIYNKGGVLIKKVSNVGHSVTIDDLKHDVYILRVNSESFKIII
ncbi:MAG: hypothetical protein K2N35_08230 [Muribaculaceae bacterium]|nr:hypothetical protein [Muribaculaceae bacterium]